MNKKIAIIFVSVFIALNFIPVTGFKSSLAQTSPVISNNILVSPSANADPHDETSIVVSPLNEQILVGASKVIVGGSSGSGSTQVKYYFSSDGGQTWGSNLLNLETPQKTWEKASDPVLAVDTNGTFHLCVLLFDITSFDSGIYIYTSTDNGRNFTNPIPVTFDVGSGTTPKQADKCWITIDTSATSNFKNTIYVAWTLTDRDAQGFPRASIKSAYRRPDALTFSTEKTISHFGDMRGVSLATGPNGEFYAVWEGIGSPKVLLFNASTDGGETFLPPVAAPSTDLNIHNFTGSLDSPNPAINVIGVSRINSFPSIDVDRSNGANRGMIYISWAETTNRSDADIFLIRLTPPNGFRPDISLPVKINDDATNADQFFPSLKVDQSNGDIYVAFYDRRDAQPSMNAYLARSTNGGATFEPNIRISSENSNPRVQATVLGGFGNEIGIGDYLAISAQNKKAHLLWTDTRNQKQEIFYSNVNYASPGGGGGGGGEGLPGDICAVPRVINILPFKENLDIRPATSAIDDPVSCSGSANNQTVWYSLTPAVNTTYGIDTIGSDFDTVVSVYTGNCGALNQIACSDDFGNLITESNRSVLVFSANAGTTYLIEVAAKGTGGNLQIRLGFPTIISAQYTVAPNGAESVKVTGAGFIENNSLMIVTKNGEDIPMTTHIVDGARQGDNTFAQIFGTRKKIHKVIKPNKTVVLRIESPVGGNRVTQSIKFVR
ncbi:MAG: sialidase family protein [Acidobacteriota bacterium]